MNCLFGYWNQLWLILSSIGKLEFFPRKVIMLVCRRDWFLFCFKMNTLSFCVFTFHVDYEMYSLSIWKLSLWKVPAFGRGWTIVVLQDKRLWIVSKISGVFKGCVLLILTMICFAFFLARMTGAGWCYRSGTLSTLFGNAP